MPQQIFCINRIDHTSPHYRITHVGWPGKKIPAAQAIRNIEQKLESYFVKPPGASHFVDVIVKYREGRPYLTTEADGDKQDNLLSLPECP
ncbi:MAG: DUF3892 domain-containing protein [Chitinophagaceae bacterium]|nr:DUF3892 domain-containing protein [Chitinophagaceae bacterium]